MHADVAVTIMGPINTFLLASFKDLRVHPRGFSTVMISTVLVVVFTHNLAIGAGDGVFRIVLFFAQKILQVLRLRSYQILVLMLR